MSTVKHIRAFVLIALVALTTICGGAQAQTDNDSRDKILSELKPYKHKFITKELNLSKEQQREFLPLYDKMDAELQKINEETRKLEKETTENADATDTEIEAASRAIFGQKEKEAEVELSYFDKFKEVLSPRQLLMLKGAERRFTQLIMRQHRRLSRERVDADTRR